MSGSARSAGASCSDGAEEATKGIGHSGGCREHGVWTPNTGSRRTTQDSSSTEGPKGGQQRAGRQRRSCPPLFDGGGSANNTPSERALKLAGLGFELLALVVALAATCLDQWLRPAIATDKLMGGTKWAITHATSAGLWTVCLDEGASMLSASSEFHGETPFCTRETSAFYTNQVYGTNHWPAIVAVQFLGVLFVGAAAAKLCVGVVLYALEAGYLSGGVSTLDREIRVANLAGTAALPLLGYSVLGVMIAVLKSIEEDEYAKTGAVHNYAGSSFWLWLTATALVALSIFLSMISPPTPAPRQPENRPCFKLTAADEDLPPLRLEDIPTAME